LGVYKTQRRTTKSATAVIFALKANEGRCQKRSELRDRGRPVRGRTRAVASYMTLQSS